MAWSTILVEILGGLAVLVGAFVTLASLPMAAVLLVATFTVHLPYGFSSIKLNAVTAAGPQLGPPGYEVNLLYLVSRRPGFGWSRTASNRWPDQKAEEDRIIAKQGKFKRGSIKEQCPEQAHSASKGPIFNQLRKKR
jgi:hypothetical protein